MGLRGIERTKVSWYTVVLSQLSLKVCMRQYGKRVVYLELELEACVSGVIQGLFNRSGRVGGG